MARTRQQAFKILGREKTQVRYNAEWLSKLSFLDMRRRAKLTVQLFLTREAFASDDKRCELPARDVLQLMLAYDAWIAHRREKWRHRPVFNILTAGRKLLEAVGQRPQIGIFVQILPGMTRDQDVQSWGTIFRSCPLRGYVRPR